MRVETQLDLERPSVKLIPETALERRNLATMLWLVTGRTLEPKAFREAKSFTLHLNAGTSAVQLDPAHLNDLTRG